MRLEGSRAAAALFGLALLSACDHRSVSLSDATIPARERVPARDLPPDSLHRRDRPGPSCTTLVLRNQVALGLTNAAPVQAVHPDLAFDGASMFGATWISRSPNGGTSSLSFATVSLEGKTKVPGGLFVGEAKGEVEPELLRSGAGYEILYAAPGGAATLSRVDGEGKPITSLTGIGAPHQFALAPHSLGTAVLYVNPQITELRFAVFASTGPASDKLIHTGEPYWRLWLSPRSDGYAASWGKRFARLDPNGVLLQAPATVLAADGITTRHVALPGGGYAIAYARGSDFQVELQRLDAAGKPVGAPRPVGQANIGAAPLKQIGLAVTGSGELVVSFPSIKPGEGVKAQLLDPEGAKLGSPLLLPPCLITSSATGAAVAGAGRIAIASVDGYSGLPATEICVSLLECS